MKSTCPAFTTGPRDSPGSRRGKGRLDSVLLSLETITRKSGVSSSGDPTIDTEEWNWMDPTGFPRVTPELLSEATRRIRSVTNAKLIVLFGSRARGDFRPDSDLDILVVAESSLPRWRRAAPIRRALAGLFPAKDIVVYTPAEVEEWQNVPNAFITTILREGRVLYHEGQKGSRPWMDPQG